MVSLFSLGFYLWKCSLKDNDKQASLNEGFIILLSSNGIIAGLSLSLLYFDNEFTKNIPNNIPSFYLFIGGAAVVWVSLESIIKTFKDASFSNTKNSSSHQKNQD